MVFDEHKNLSYTLTFCLFRITRVNYGKTIIDVDWFSLK